MKLRILAPLPEEYMDMLYSERPEHDGDVFSLRHPKMPPAQAQSLKMLLRSPFQRPRSVNMTMSTRQTISIHVILKAPLSI